MTYRVLVADDSSTIQKVVKIAFVRHPLELIEATSFMEALTVLARGKPHLLMIDATLPGTKGPQDFVKLQADAGGCPLLLLVGSYDAVDEKAFQAAGIRSILKKPFDSADIVKLVESLLHISGGEKNPPPPPAPRPPKGHAATVVGQSPLVPPSPPGPPMRAGGGSVPSGNVPASSPVPPPPPMAGGAGGAAPAAWAAPSLTKGRSDEQGLPPIPGEMARGTEPFIDLYGDASDGRAVPPTGFSMRTHGRARPDDKTIFGDPEESFVKSSADLELAALPDLSEFGSSPHLPGVTNLFGVEESDPSSAIPPGPPLFDGARRAQKAFDAATVPFPASGPLSPDPQPKRSLPASLTQESPLEDLTRDLPELVRRVVEDYCDRHFKSLAREFIASELRRLADEKARHLVDN